MYEIKQKPENFIVEEITLSKKVLEINKKQAFKKSQGDQLICCLQKKNWDTHLAIKKIAKQLQVSRKRIGFAGTKDKKAVTVQLISIWGVKKEDAEKLRIKDIVLQPLRYSKKRIELGDLLGNRFTVKVYSEKKPGKTRKIPNYFGVQRFGKTRPITHLVGKEILKGNFEKAVKIYLAKVFPEENEDARKAREKLAENWDYSEALKCFPKNLEFERTMLSHLAENPNDYVGALRKLPKFLKIMFVHSFQSHLFNKFLKEVIKRKLKYKTGPLCGYELKLKNKLEKEVLEKEGLKLEDFLVKSMPEMSSKGMRRNLFIQLKNFKILEQGKNYYVVRFCLPKGGYATTVIDQLF